MQNANITELQKGIYLIQAKAPEPLTAVNNKQRKIINYGAKNNYPQEILRAINRSSYGASCVKTFASYIFGNGIKVSQDTPFSREIQYYLLTHEFLQKIIYDYAMFGGFAFQCRFNSNGNIAMRSFNGSGMVHVDFSTIRLGNYDETTFDVRTAWISQDWEQYTKKEYKPIEIELFDVIKARQAVEDIKQRGTGSYNGQLFYTKQYKPGEPFYPSPVWAAGLSWIYCDGQIGEFHENNIDNGFFPSVILYHPGIMSGEKTADGRDVIDALKEDLEQFQGAENSGKIFNLFGPSRESAPQLIPISANNNADLFNTLAEIIEKKIVSAFQMPKLLAGIETPGALGSTNEIANSIEMYVSQIQGHIKFVEQELNRVLQYVEGYDGTKVELVTNKPISYLDPDFLAYLDESEIRTSLGYPATRPSQQDTTI